MLQDLENSIQVLNRRGVIIYPTDTIWGIGCDATNKQAVQKILKIKKRADSKSMLILVDDIRKIKNYVAEIPDISYKLIENTKKPLTIIFPDAINLPENLINKDGSVGIRVVKDEFCRQLLFRFGKPIVSTSANESGKPSPGNFTEIEKNLLSKADYIVKWRSDEISTNVPSSIIKITKSGKIEVIRE